MNSRKSRDKRLEQLSKEKRKQPGIEFPKSGQQQHVLIIRIDLAPPNRGREELSNIIQKGLKQLCGLFEQLDIGKKKIDKLDNGNLVRLSLNKFNFSATLGPQNENQLEKDGDKQDGGKEPWRVL